MSERQAKKRRRALRAAGLDPEQRVSDDTVTMDNIGPYLRDILKRYPGWNFISISKPGCMCVGSPEDDRNKMIVPIQVHKLLPAMDDNGLYDAGDNRTVMFTELTNPKFQGLVMDRRGKACLGDPFHVELDDPEMEATLNQVFQPKKTEIDLRDADVQQL